MALKENATKENVVVVKIDGDMSDAESETVSRTLATEIEKTGATRLLIFMEDYASFNTAEDLYFNLGFARRHAENIERMAVIGDQRWRKTWVALFGLFSGIESAYFERAEAEEAWQWVREKS